MWGLLFYSLRNVKHQVKFLEILNKRFKYVTKLTFDFKLRAT